MKFKKLKIKFKNWWCLKIRRLDELFMKYKINELKYKLNLKKAFLWRSTCSHSFCWKKRWSINDCFFISVKIVFTSHAILILIICLIFMVLSNKKLKLKIIYCNSNMTYQYDIPISFKTSKIVKIWRIIENCFWKIISPRFDKK